MNYIKWQKSMEKSYSNLKNERHKNANHLFEKRLKNIRMHLGYKRKVSGGSYSVYRDSASKGDNFYTRIKFISELTQKWNDAMRQSDTMVRNYITENKKNSIPFESKLNSIKSRSYHEARR